MLQNVASLAAFYDTPSGAGGAAHHAAPAPRLPGPISKACGCWAMALPCPICAPFAGGGARHRRHARRPWASPRWPGSRNASPPCVEEDALPFPDVFFDRILVVHGLEGAESLAPAAAPALAGAGAGRAHPAGGAQPRQPVGAGGLLALRPWPALFPRRTGRDPARCAVRAAALGRARCMPRRSTAARCWAAARAGNRSGRGCSPGIGGVHLVEATKSLYAAGHARTPGAPARELKPARTLIA